MHSWIPRFPEIKDPVMLAAWTILEGLLLTSTGAYLKDAMAKAGIGADTYGGIATYRRQPTFEVVVQGAEADQRDAFEKVIVSTLTNVVKNGIPKRKLQAAINSYEFREREQDYRGTPKGLMFTIRMLADWLYDDNAAFDTFADNAVFDKLRKLSETDYFEKLIETYLLQSRSGLVLSFIPKQGLSEELDAALTQKLAEKKATMSDEELDALIEQTKELKKFQETPSTEEELEKIPMLEKDDIAKETRRINYEVKDYASRPLIFCKTETNGIIYTNYMFDVQSLDITETPYLEVLAILMFDLDTENYSYSEFDDEIKFVSGSVYNQNYTFTRC